MGRYGFLKIVIPNDCFESTKMVFSEIGLCFHNHQLVVPNIFGLAMNPQQSRRCWTCLFKINKTIENILFCMPFFFFFFVGVLGGGGGVSIDIF